MDIPAPTGSALLLSRAFSSPAIRGRSLISTAHGQQARYYSTGALVIDKETVKVLVTGVANCSSLANECLAEIHTVQDLQVITLVVILSGIAGACYVGQQAIDRGSEVMGQLKKHAPEILGGVCDEFLFQMKIPLVGSGRRLVFKDHWFNNPEKALSRREQRMRRRHEQRMRRRHEQRMRRELARQERGRLQREQFNRAEQERKRAAAPMYEESMARKQVNDQITRDRLGEERRRQLTGE